MHPSQLSLPELLRECRARSDRRGGPGGQHRNKVQTAVVITHLPTGISGEGNERRSQIDNRRNALFRLRLALALQYRSPAASAASPPNEPSELWFQRASGGRIHCAPTHDDYPSLLAELLDSLQAAEHEIGHVANRLQTTPSQLVKLLRGYAPALQLVNAAREARGLNRLN